MGMVIAKNPAGRGVSIYISHSFRNSFDAAKKRVHTQEGAASFYSRKESRK